MLPFILQAGAGLAQTLIGGAKARKTQKELEGMANNTPIYNQSKSILDFYNQALSRYNTSPTDTAMYKRQIRDIDRGTGSALNYLQDRRSATAGASSILRASNDAKLDANAQAEQLREQRFGQLGGAASMKASEEGKAFQQNQVLPFELKYNLKSQKAGAANQLVNSGLSNIFGGFQNFNNAMMQR